MRGMSWSRIGSTLVEAQLRLAHVLHDVGRVRDSCQVLLQALPEAHRQQQQAAAVEAVGAKAKVKAKARVKGEASRDAEEGARSAGGGRESRGSQGRRGNSGSRASAVAEAEAEAIWEAGAWVAAWSHLEQRSLGGVLAGSDGVVPSPMRERMGERSAVERSAEKTVEVGQTPMKKTKKKTTNEKKKTKKRRNTRLSMRDMDKAIDAVLVGWEATSPLETAILMRLITARVPPIPASVDEARVIRASFERRTELLLRRFEAGESEASGDGEASGGEPIQGRRRGRSRVLMGGVGKGGVGEGSGDGGEGGRRGKKQGEGSIDMGIGAGRGEEVARVVLPLNHRLDNPLKQLDGMPAFFVPYMGLVQDRETVVVAATLLKKAACIQ